MFFLCISFLALIGFWLLLLYFHYLFLIEKWKKLYYLFPANLPQKNNSIPLLFNRFLSVTLMQEPTIIIIFAWTIY